MEEKPNYFAIIPADVRYDEELKLGAKMMYGEITSLTYKTGECWASNNYFATLYKVTPQAISKWIKALEKQKYITIEYEKEGKSITKRIIKLVSTTVDRGINHSLEGYQPEIKGNNTSINNTSKKEIYKERFKKPT
ncbi:MAG: helix-turn-helix domain-containing protein, partial [Romboutsia sp.]|nr:helix-turn-helix domain-containing protein [Romboutsia sp.]